MNPIDILGVHPSGAHARAFDERDYGLGSPEIGQAIEPFNWKEGYDIEKDLDFILPTKDQGSAGSCGGETISEYAQTITSAFLHETSEKSAKAHYSQVFVPGGGSNSRALGDVCVKQGFYKEALVPSYPKPGVPPTEAFMERAADISAAARADAAKTAGLVAYVYPAINIDVMAAAMKANKGILIGIHGSNNGTWLSSHPSPKQVGDFWAHFMFGGKAGIVKGKKGIWAKQSWGADCAPDTNGWQFISEDHFTAGRIWDAMVLVYSEKPVKPHHVFSVDIAYGQTSEEVAALQNTLAADGCFNLAPTGYYGDITAQAVLKFRVKHGVDSSTDPKGRIVGPRTRSALNAL